MRVPSPAASASSSATFLEIRKLMRQVGGPPGGVDCSQPWHEILHLWNERVRCLIAYAGVRTWSDCCLKSYWRLATYVKLLPGQRWVQRLLAWQPAGRRSQGRPVNTWDLKLVQYCRWRHVGERTQAAQDKTTWLSWTDHCVVFARGHDL